MNVSCQLSRRWHQQFCRSPNFAGHQQCLQTFLPVREYRQATKIRVHRPIQNQERDHSPLRTPPLPRKSNIVVREYEPNPYDRSKLDRVQPNQEVVDEMSATRMELMKLEQELAVLRQGPFGPQSEFMQSLPKDEREQLLQALTKEGVLQGEQEDLITMAELERLAEEDDQEVGTPSERLGVTLRIPRKDQAYIRHFNKALRESQETESVDIQRNLHLWKWYLRCQQQVHNFSNLISEDVWQFLWQSQADLKVRPKHLVMLAKDMINVKTALDSHKWMAYIESLHASGDTASAISVWQEQKDRLRADSELSSAFWAVGVDMYATIGRPSKAQELALNTINSGKAEPQILVPVIAAWTKSRNPDALVKAWTCYLKLKEKAGNTIRPEVYEKISNEFLETDHGDMALSVFKDMLLMTEASTADSKQVRKEAARASSVAIQSALSEEEINRVGLKSLLGLPKRFQNRFFFASWIKKLIGEKRLNSAAMVVDLMYERGITPDARPLNGIIGAWLREGTVSSQRKAENLAWSMIEARVDFVAFRDATSGSQGKIFRKVIIEDESRALKRRVPSATIETFSILLQHYTRRQDNVQAEKLTNTMINSCKIQPNAYIMNHWLYGDLRAGRIMDVWNKYCTLKRDISPDLETYAALWDCAKVQCSKADSTHVQNFPSARSLFAEMQDWMSTLKPNKARKAREEFSSELYEQIIRVFCLSTDMPGTLLAMHQMVRLFGIYPTNNAVRLMCGQASRLLPQTEGNIPRTARLRRSAARHKPAMAQIADIIDTLESKRKFALVEQGANAEVVEDPQSELGQQVRLAVLTEFMCMFMQKGQGETDSYVNDVKIAAQTMHCDLEGIDLTVAGE